MAAQAADQVAQEAADQAAGSVGSIMDQVKKLTDEERQELIANLVEDYEKQVQVACRDFEKCDSCGKMVSSVTENCQGYKHYQEDCCDDCVTHCICGEDYAPSGNYHHEDCYSYYIRCYCGKVNDSERKWKAHGPQCSRLAQLRFSIQGDPTSEQRKAISKALTYHEMVQEEGDWVSTRAYPVEAFSTFGSMIDAYPRSLFGESCSQQLADIPLEFVELTLLFTDKDGWVETKTLDDLDDKFGVPDPDSDEVYKSLAIRMVMQVPERTLKKARKPQQIE